MESLVLIFVKNPAVDNGGQRKLITKSLWMGLAVKILVHMLTRSSISVVLKQEVEGSIPSGASKISQGRNKSWPDRH